MKRLFKLFFIISILSLILFYNWASSGNLSESEYAKVVKYNFSSETNTQPTDSIYSIVTYNIGYLSGMTNNKAVYMPQSLFETNMKRVEQELKKLDPDIIALQEIDYNASRSYHVNQQNELAKLGYNYVAQAVNWDEKYLPFPYYPISKQFGQLISGQSILSKYPIKEHQRIVLERDQTTWFFTDAFYIERLIQITKIILDNQDVIVMNIHLDAFNFELRRSQLKKVLQVFETYKKDFPVILLGDFNSDPNYKDAAINVLLNDPALGNAAFDKSSLELTFNTEQPFERLDFIFYEKEKIKLIEAKVLRSFGQASDHFPLYMSFKIL